jgi:hypothetical protein
MNELDQRTPSVVFEARLDGQLNILAKIDVDGKTVTKWTRGEALRLDPGEHHFQFLLEPYPPVVQTLLLGEGMRYRLVSAEFKSPNALTAPTPAPNNSATPPVAWTRERPVPILVYPLLGVGAVGLAGFVGLVLSGNAEHDNLAKTCAPYCTEAQVNPMRVRYLIGDISLGVGAMALIGAGVLYLTRPEHVVEPRVGFTTFPHGAMATVAWRGL